MNAFVMSMPGIAVVVVLCVSVQKKFDQTTAEMIAHTQNMTIVARNPKNAAGRGEVVADQAAWRPTHNSVSRTMASHNGVPVALIK